MPVEKPVESVEYSLYMIIAVINYVNPRVVKN